MSKTVLSELDGFTPVIDSLVAEVGPIPALVFGRVWRYCQMEDQVCRAAQQTIADELGISRRTLQRALEELVEKGYLAEVPTQTVNHYKDTGKAGLSIKISASTAPNLRSAVRQNGAVENPTAPNSHSAVRQNDAVQCANLAHKDSTKKEVKKEELEYESEPAEKFSTMRKTIETLTGRLSTPGDVSTIEKFVAEGVIEEDIRSALAWRVSQGLRPVANIRQLESGVLRNKADRVQAAAAATVKPGVTAGQPAKKETALDRTKAALQKVMAEALREEELHNVN